VKADSKACLPDTSGENGASDPRAHLKYKKNNKNKK
jgi:hypothetical protein